MSGWILAVAVAALVALVIWVQWRTGAFLQYLYFCRFPLLVAAVLAAFPFVATRTGAASLFENLFSLHSHEVFLVSWLALLTAWVVMISTEVVLWNAHLRFRVRPVTVPPWVSRLRPLLFALLAVPMIATVCAQSAGEAGAGTGPLAWAVARGALAALACLVVTAILHSRLLPFGAPGGDLVLPGIGRLLAKRQAGRRRVPLPRRLQPPAAPAGAADETRWPLEGYIERDTGFLRPGHLLAMTFLVVTLAVYVYQWFQGPVPAGLPALGYVLLILILAGWLLPAVSFLLDRYRVPVLTLLILGSFLLSQVNNTDHYYRIGPKKAQAPAPPPSYTFDRKEAAEAVQREHPVVIVAASGGGITASLWTAVVLTSLQRAAGPSFTRSIRLISSVSGGSTGTLYFLDRYGPGGFPPPEELDRIVAAAGTSSLDSTAWGLAYPDLWRAFPGFVRDPTKDRGWAMERAWREQMVNKDATLAGWQAKVVRGELPDFVFNATAVETGRQFLFTPLAPAWRSTFFSQAYPGRDIPVVTAARLSATFPWVSPITRPCIEDCGGEAIPNLHLADGGYFDNFGVVTVINWVRSLRPDQRKELASHRILLILIRAFPSDDGEEAGDSRNREEAKANSKGWLYATVGPILTIVNVRNVSQDDRNVTEISLLKDLLRSEVEDRLEVVPFELSTRSPLSWKLTAEQARTIRQGIQDDPGNQRCLDRVREIFQRAPGTAVPGRPCGPQ